MYKHLAPEDLRAILDRMEVGTATYDDAADLFMGSMTGARTGMGRDQFLECLRGHFPTQAELQHMLVAYSARLNGLLNPSRQRH